MNYDLTDYYYDSGKLPERYYNQLNGKTADQNYREYKNKRFKLSRKKFSLEDFVMNLLRASLDVALNEIMDSILPKN